MFLYMATQETVSEDTILMPDTEESSDIETAILNSRLVEQSDPFQITNVTITEALEPLSAYYVEDGETRYTQVDDSIPVRIADFTTDHIENLPSISTVGPSKLLLPISPTDLDLPTEDGSVTSYFISFTKKYRVEITLLSEDNRRETIYKVFNEEEEATTLKNKLEQDNYAKITPQGSNMAKIESISHLSVLEGLRSKIKSLIVVPIVAFLLIFVSHSVLGYLTTDSISLVISSGLAIAFSLLFLTTGVAAILDETNRENTTETVTLTTSNTTIESDLQNRTFVNPVTVQQTFSEENQSLKLSLANNQSISWSYEIDDSYLFEDSSVTDFYLNLGLENAKQNETTFKAYLSPKKVDTDIPYLNVSSVGSDLFLYSEHP